MFKVNNKDTRTYLTPCYSVSIVNFEEVNTGWAKELWICKPFNPWCPLNGHKYLNKPAVTFKWTIGAKKLK